VCDINVGPSRTSSSAIAERPRCSVGQLWRKYQCCRKEALQLSPISGPSWSNGEYLLVADYGQKNVYQLKPDSGEVRAIAVNPCQPVSLTYDPSINCLYMTCTENVTNGGGQYQSCIRKKSLNKEIDEVIYPNASQGKNRRL